MKTWQRRPGSCCQKCGKEISMLCHWTQDKVFQWEGSGQPCQLQGQVEWGVAIRPVARGNTKLTADLRPVLMEWETAAIWKGQEPDQGNLKRKLYLNYLNFYRGCFHIGLVCKIFRGKKGVCLCSQNVFFHKEILKKNWGNQRVLSSRNKITQNSSI